MVRVDLPQPIDWMAMRQEYNYSGYIRQDTCDTSNFDGFPLDQTKSDSRISRDKIFTMEQHT